MCVKCSQLVPAGLLFSCTKSGEGQDTYVSMGGVLVDESPVVICMHCAQAAFPKRDAYKIRGIQHPATPFQIAKDGSDHDYRELYHRFRASARGSCPRTYWPCNTSNRA